MPTKKQKTLYIVLGVAAAAGIGYYLYSRNAVAAEPTFKKTALSTLPEMKADLLSWSQQVDPGWHGKQPIIYQAVLTMGDAAIRNMHLLLWDLWQPGAVNPYSVDGNMKPAAWDNSVGKWWENLSKQLAL